MKEEQVSVSVQKKDTWVEVGVSFFEPTYITGIILSVLHIKHFNNPMW